MKFVIDFNEETSVFKVFFERSETSKASGDPWPPPPPGGGQLEEMTAWLNECYPEVCKKFEDGEVSGLTRSFQASPYTK